MKRHFAAVIAVIAVIATGIVVSPAAPAPSAQAATASDFNAGNIISDQLFYDGGAMTEGQVQSFLNAQMSACRAGYTCLKDYAQATPNRAAVAYRCEAYQGSPGEKAASIIAKVGAACGISQKVLLVMLEKEQSLVGDTWPSKLQYNIAMGYGCPDTANCDQNYYGFFNQVYAAALQFKNYQANPTRWNHVAGRVNTVRYHPNAACGSSQVYIQNNATAGLYNYTPYQPNASALANLYGTGDGCGAYGNRNFWRLYTDWFGSTTGASSLVRTTANPTVYVVSGTKKYPVPNESMLSALAPLGLVTFVSQSYLDKYTTAQSVGRIMRDTNGKMYFFDAGSKLPFGSCEMVAHYGGACDEKGYVQLTNEQVAGFATGPVVTRVLGTIEGGRYAMTDGRKREILDARSQAEAGLEPTFNVLTEAGIANLPLDPPIIRESAFVQQRGTNDYSFLGSAQRYAMDGPTATAMDLAPGRVGTLSAASLGKITQSSTAFTGVVRMPGYTISSVLSNGLRYDWQDAPGAKVLPFVPASQEFVGAYPMRGALGQNSIIKSSSEASVYLVDAGLARKFSSWTALTTIAGTTSPPIVSVPQGLVTTIGKGTAILTPGTLLRTVTSPKLYLIDGTGSKILLSTFGPSNEMGITGWDYASDAELAPYATTNAPLSYGVQCGTQRYIASGGSLHAVAEADAALWPIAFTPLSDITCKLLKKGTAAGKFIRTPDGRISLLEGGQKRSILTFERLAELGGTYGGWLDVPADLGAQVPAGPNA
ncbi:hypothetical protein [Plantibacter sp. ME-Dv--P-122b]|uniref:hypothetical protein n=1 Tax=Plantibacter sp. ME-Dv--P-122b TaxID=3040300 RepID=UPI00254F06DF|nr:hypothetical protein [Plantibacter sp. ME-Dv--P-122b]